MGAVSTFAATITPGAGVWAAGESAALGEPDSLTWASSKVEGSKNLDFVADFNPVEIPDGATYLGVLCRLWMAGSIENEFQVSMNRATGAFFANVPVPLVGPIESTLDSSPIYSALVHGWSGTVSLSTVSGATSSGWVEIDSIELEVQYSTPPLLVVSRRTRARRRILR